MSAIPKVFIETERIFIREINLDSDYGLLYAQQKDEHVMQFFDGPWSDTKINTILNKLQQHLISYGFSVGPVFEKHTNKCIGRAGLVYHDFNGPPDIEFAIFLLKPFWNKGYGTEICRALIEYAFNVLNTTNIFATIDSENQGVIKILKKLGMNFVKEEYYSTHDKIVQLYVKNKFVN